MDDEGTAAAVEIVIANMQKHYTQLCHTVYHEGAQVSPRGQETREMLGVTIKHINPVNSLVQYVGRGASTQLAALEALQLIAGVSESKLMTKVAPNTRQFLTDADKPWQYFHGAYGPRVEAYMHQVIKRLREDHDTRQAVVTIWDNRQDQRSEPDLPCTLSLHFMIRDERLDLHVTMRSNDVWWGTAHDVFVFTTLQTAVAHTLDLPCGNYYHHANSLHIYQRDYHKLSQLHLPTGVPAVPAPLGWVGARWIDVQEQAAAFIYHGSQAEDVEPNDWWQRQADRWLQ